MMVPSLHDVTGIGLRMLYFTRHYTNICQGILMSFMLFSCKFVKVYVCQKLLKYSLVKNLYICKNKLVQFFDSQSTSHQ